MTSNTPSSSLIETVTFIVHAIKQMCWGFERLNGVADDYRDGSAAKAFYLSALYNYIAVFYLLDKGGKPIGGAFYQALEPHGLQHVLAQANRVLDERIGTTTFGEVVRVIRNKAVVHPSYRDADLDRLYSQVDMLDPANQARLQSLLVQLDGATREIAWQLVQTTGLPPQHFGMRDKEK
jgi:hypothetical protein